MNLSDLPGQPGRTRRKRLGRGTGSGRGKTSGRGHKGQKSRSGGSLRPGFEGGQRPLQLRVPKRGFKNLFRQEYAVVNVEALNRFPDGSIVTPELLEQSGLARRHRDQAGVKVLGQGSLEKSLEVRAHCFSNSAAEKIARAGGKAEVI